MGDPALITSTYMPEEPKYLRDAVAAKGGRDATENWLRLFLMPGVYHCGAAQVRTRSIG